jgi:hypothetical protein
MTLKSKVSPFRCLSNLVFALCFGVLIYYFFTIHKHVEKEVTPIVRHQFNGGEVLSRSNTFLPGTKAAATVAERVIAKTEYLDKPCSQEESAPSLPIDPLNAFIRARSNDFTKPPASFKPSSTSKSHVSSNNAVFSCAMSKTYTRDNVIGFVGTLRKYGFRGDIVAAVVTDSKPNFIKEMLAHGVILYYVEAACDNNGMDCSIPGTENNIYMPNAMLRFFMYNWWSAKYSPTSWILLSDFRDVFFQANPFQYRPYEWNSYQLVAFQETHPVKTIKRCKHNSNWVKLCYGRKGLQTIGSNTVSCSGTVMGIPSAITAYSILMVDQIRSKVRGYGNDECLGTRGIDQGFHNWLLYTDQLSSYMAVKLFQQGEGPVNTVGAFLSGANQHPFGLNMTKDDFTQFGWFHGGRNERWVSNWNSDRSPVVHQLDRFLTSKALPGYGVLDAYQGIGYTGE